MYKIKLKSRRNRQQSPNSKKQDIQKMETKDVKKAINKMKNRKAAGSDEITAQTCSRNTQTCRNIPKRKHMSSIY